MATQALLALKAASQSKACEEQQAWDRQRDTTVLVHHFLTKHGFVETASKLQQEGGSFLSHFESADNISLARIVQEYEDYHCIKFGNRPILTRTVGGGEGEHRIKSYRRRSATAARRRISQKFSSQQEQSNAGKFSQESGVLATIEGKLGIPIHGLGKRSGVMKGGSYDANSQSDDSGLVIEGGPCRTAMNKLLDEAKDDLDGGVCHKKEHRFLKPNPSFGGDIELRNLAASLSSDIIQESPGVTWQDVIDLDGPKLLLKEALIMPQKYPQLFTGIRSQWRGILLHGVPGTGKTLLAKAVASQSNTTFFSISASSIVSKYRGDSEKLVRVLFELARHHAPSTIFLDEIDAILGHRSSGGGPEGGGALGEHEGSRRMKTELLIQMDGIVQGEK